MKRKVSLLLCSLILGFLLSSCMNTTQHKTAPELTYQAACDLYSQAQEIYAWYMHGLMVVDDSQTIIDNNNVYYLCMDDKLPDNCNIDGLRKYLENYFAKDFVASLLQENPCQFVEKGGVLYAGTFGFGSNPYTGKERLSEELEKLSDTEFRLTMYVEILNQDLEFTGEEEEYQFYLIDEDGKWVFRDFQLAS